jgi:hypothetical protein
MSYSNQPQIVKFNYINWWTGDKVHELEIFLSYCFDQYDIYLSPNSSNVKECVVTICSLFGNLHSIAHAYSKKDSIVLFYTGENTDAWKDWREEVVYPHVDIIAGFFNRTDKSVRCPLWCFYNDFWKDGLFTPSNFLNGKNEVVCIARNPSNRYQLGTLCQQAGLTLSSNLPNIEYIIPGSKPLTQTLDKTIQSKLNCLKEFNYCLCPENTDAEGYTTEKIFHALEAGCIPIYYPKREVEKEIINNKCVVLIDQNDSPTEVKSKIEETIKYVKHEIIDTPLNVWMKDASFHIMMLYFGLWKKVYTIAKQKGWILHRKNNIHIIYYTIDTSNLNDPTSIKQRCIEKCKEHCIQYKSIFTYRPVFIIDNKEIDIEELL